MKKGIAFCIWMVLCFFAMHLSIASSFANNLEDVLRDGGLASGGQDAPIPKLEDERTAEDKVNSVIFEVIEVLLVISGVVAVVFIVVGGVEYTVSAGAEDRINGAKAKLKYALLGLVVVIFSYAILTNAINFLEVAE